MISPAKGQKMQEEGLERYEYLFTSVQAAVFGQPTLGHGSVSGDSSADRDYDGPIELARAVWTSDSCC
jgi:hypothetical protein